MVVLTHFLPEFNRLRTSVLLPGIGAIFQRQEGSKVKRVLLAAALAAGILVASPTSAGAWATYCDWDPLVLIVTPAGHIVVVYDSVWTSSPLNLGIPLESYTVARGYDAAGHPVTVVDMTIT